MCSPVTCTVRAVIQETLRLFPPVHTIVRASGPKRVVVPLTRTKSSSTRGTASNPITPPATAKFFPSSNPPSPSPFQTFFRPPTPNYYNQESLQPQTPLYIPPDTSISIIPLLIHKCKDTWGEDADIFDPDRWLDERMNRVLKNPMMFVPFNAGPRIVSPPSHSPTFKSLLHSSSSVSVSNSPWTQLHTLLSVSYKHTLLLSSQQSVNRRVVLHHPIGKKRKDERRMRKFS